ncbi:MAG: sugar ABC transporter substrate-binding protein [Lachnospiraceae bacterium]|nr:sugar ABC transporter substrate-binding protein [Lachnospiraceae bacterium]MCD7766841.1 sugar ABC transporter substrate-binding protein [Lachnospiraceae bacterium]
MKRITKKNLVAASAAALLVATTAFAPVASADEVVTLRLAVWDYDIDGPTTYDPIIEAFEEANPDIQIEIVNASASDYETKLTTMLAGGDDIDLFFAKSNTSLPGLYSRGYCLNLSDLFEADGYDLTNYGTVLEQQMTFDGGVYALPFRTNDWLLFYNKDIFDAAGVDYPTNDMTWEEISDLAKQIVDNTDDDSIYGFSFNPKLGFIFPFLTEGEDGFDISTTDFSSTEKCIDWILDLVDYGAMESYSSAQSLSKDQTYFYNGEWAMMWNGSWYVQNLTQNADSVDFEWGVANQPYFEGTEQTNFVTSTPLCISSASEHVDEAYRFLTFVCGEEGASILATTNLVPGYMNDAVLESYLANVDLDDQSIEALTNNTTHGFGEPTTTFSQIISAGQTELELVLTGNEDAAAFIESIIDQREEIIENE